MRFGPLYHPLAETRIREMEPERYASILVTKAVIGDVEKASVRRKFGDWPFWLGSGRAVGAHALCAVSACGVEATFDVVAVFRYGFYGRAF